jgi:hypothetical protein
VAGEAGIAPILVAEIDRVGRFTRGVVHSAQQIRPNGPSWDPAQRAFHLIRRLTQSTFDTTMFEFADDGSFTPQPTAD